jgi:hypothetical protein
LCAFAHCQIDYEKELLEVKFQGCKEWQLHRIIISFNGIHTKTHSFESSDNVVSCGFDNNITFELSIAEMKILFYSSKQKTFQFDLVYGPIEGKDIFKTK